MPKLSGQVHPGFVPRAMRNLFKVVGWIEGISLLTLFFYAMPMKYIYGEPHLVKVVGSVHGGLFLAYVLVAFMMFDRENWTQKKLGTAVILSAVPFGTFIFEWKFNSSSSPKSRL